METTKKVLTAEESLDLIARSISNFKNNYVENSNFFLLWGWIISLASFACYGIIRTLCAIEKYSLINSLIWINWASFILIGMILQVFIVRKLKKTNTITSHPDRFIKVLWQVSGVSTLFAVFIAFKLEMSIPPFMLLIAGFSTSVTGIVIRFKPLIAGGIAFFIFSALSTFIKSDQQLLICGTAIICGYLIPSYLLKYAHKKQ